MLRKLIILPAAFLAFACSKDKKVDDALNSDLTTAGQANTYSPQDSISAAERANALNGTAPGRTTTSPTTVRRTTTRRTSSSGGTRTVYQSAPAPAPTVQRNTKRDAAIGAAAGAVIGATTSKNRVKGGIIGAVTGGIIGGVIGNNVDVKKKY